MTNAEYTTDNQRIDALIATKVMGWVLPEETITYWSNWRDANGNELRSVKAWQPTSDIAQAFQVVERMRELGWTYYAEWEPDDKAWVLFSNDEHLMDYVGEDESMPKAICLAALATMGVEVLD